MSGKSAFLKFGTIEPLHENSGVQVMIIPFTLHADDMEPRSFHARAVRTTIDGPVQFEFPKGQIIPFNLDAARSRVVGYYFDAISVAAAMGCVRRPGRLVREYPISFHSND